MTDEVKWLVAHIISEYGQKLQDVGRLPKPPTSHYVNGYRFVVKPSKCTKFYVDAEDYYCVEGTDFWYHKPFKARLFCKEVSFAIELQWDVYTEEAIKWCRACT